MADNPISYWRFEETEGSEAVDSGSSGTNGIYNNIELGVTSASSALGNAARWLKADLPNNPGSSNIDFEGPGVRSLAQLINVDNGVGQEGDPNDLKATSVEFWINTTQVSGNANNWRSPVIFGNESGGDGDNQWGYINPNGQIGLI